MVIKPPSSTLSQMSLKAALTSRLASKTGILGQRACHQRASLATSLARLERGGMGLLCAARVWALHVRDEFPLPGEGSVRVLLLNSSLRGRDHPFETRGVSEAEKDAPFPGVVPCFFVGFLLVGSRGSVRFSADATARRGITHVNALLHHMAEVLEKVTGNFPVECGIQGACQVVANAVGPSPFEGFDRQQPAPGYADKVCSPFYGGQDIRLVELLAESEVKVRSGSQQPSSPQGCAPERDQFQVSGRLAILPP